MAQYARGVLAAVAVVSGGAVKLKHGDAGTSQLCAGEDEVSYSQMIFQTCHLNWALNDTKTKDIFDSTRVGCWDMRVYNTDGYMSSSVYQNTADGRCNLALSGYHGKIRGYVRAAVDLSMPPVTWKMCGNRLWAPFVKIFRHHTSLANWSRIADYLGPKTNCTDLVVTGESMGGSLSEMLAACSNAERMDELQDKSLPTFQVSSLYTFGAIGSSVEPIVNPRRSDGCFKGKRVMNSMDIPGHLGNIPQMVHAKMDSLYIYSHTGKTPTFGVHACTERGAFRDLIRPRPAELLTNASFAKGNFDFWSHSATSYGDWLGFFRRAGYGALLDSKLIDANSTVYKKAVALKPTEQEHGAEGDESKQAVPESKAAEHVSHKWMVSDTPGSLD